MAISVTGLTTHTQTGAGTWKSYGSGGGGSLSTANFLSSTSSFGRKFTGAKGFAFEINASGTTMVDRIIVLRLLVNGGLGATLAAGGASIRLEDTSGNTSDFYVAGSDTYNGGWLELVIDTANAESANGGTTATLTAIQYIGILVNAAASSGGDPNVYVDEILSLPNTGLTLAGNTTNLFSEAADWDDASLYGVITRRGGAVFSKVPLILSPDASDHASTDEILIFEEPIYEDGTNVDSAITLQGLSSADTDTITLTRLTAVVENNGDITGTNATKTLDFASATDVNLIDSVFSGFNATASAVELGAATNTISGSSFSRCGQVSDTGAVIRDCTFRNSSDGAGAYLYTENSDIADCFFFSDTTGYGIRYSPTGAGPFTETLDGFTFTSYGADETANAAIHIVPVTTTVTITLNVTNGATPTTDEDAGYSGTFVIQQSVTLTVNVQDADGGAVEGAVVYLITAGAVVVLNDVTNASGVATASYTGSLPVTIDSAKSDVRHGSLATPYQPTPLSGTIDSNGYTVTAILQEDQ